MGCKNVPPGAEDPKDPRLTNPVITPYFTCQNVTMRQSPSSFPGYANGYLTVPLLDQTGLTDAYDFNLAWSGVGVFRAGGVPGQQAGQVADGAAAEPNGVISLMEAVSRQLGLKMDRQKRPVPVLVIDHLEEKPTDN